MSALYSAFLYYAATLCFGVTYNRMILFYIALFGLSFFNLISRAGSIRISAPKLKTGLVIYLVILGIALCAAWLPDILPTLMDGSLLSAIEVYTTEVTYVLDIGIISPMCFLSIKLLAGGKAAGVVTVSALLRICLFAGLAITAQSVCQYLAGIEIPMQAFIPKVLIFVVLSLVSFILQRKWYTEIAMLRKCRHGFSAQP